MNTPAASDARSRAARSGWRVGPLPGFHPTLGFVVLYLSLVVLMPLAALVLKASGLGWSELWTTISSTRALAAYRLSFGGALVAAAINAGAGFLLAWVLVRYRFPGRALVDAVIDLPLALPTAVAGIALTAIYAPTGTLGAFLESHGVKVAFSPLGVVLAMVFVGLPFTVRAVQPVLMSLDPQLEEAAAVLGASRLRTFLRVILPVLIPPVLTGFALAFARAVGEYGSIVFISGNMPNQTEIRAPAHRHQAGAVPVPDAAALALVMLAGSLVTLMGVNLLQAWSRRGSDHG